jgi:DNA polymerase I-like protein with 3'-5' exonuclease and polymerase domains
VLLTGDTKAKVSNFAGSILKLFKGTSATEYWEILVVSSITRLISVPSEPFIVARYLSKLAAPSAWLALPKLDYKVIQNVHDYNEALEFLRGATAIAVDIETMKPVTIRCISYSAVVLTSGIPNIKTWVLHLKDMDSIHWMRVLNALPAPKITQNGKYDHSYLYLYNAVCANWIWDTATMHHCWYAELPKDLGYLSAFYVRDARYWKGAHDSKNLNELAEYAARDTHNTACVFLAWVHESPDWAKRNYLMEFPVNYPAHVCEMTGIKLDTERLETVKAEKLIGIAAEESRLATLVGVPNFNCGSPKQVKALTKLLNGQELPSTDEKSLVKLGGKHPLNKLLVDLILNIRGERKLVSTYLKEDIAFSIPDACPSPRIVYSINPHGTDTGRNASKKHHFWVGLNIQNIPRGDTIKQIALAEPDFMFGEADYSQAETRGTGYITGETKLIDAVEGKLGYADFHSYNASAFFGTPYNQIFDDAKGKTLDKGLRDLSKRVNHGANYNMGASVLVDTMSEANVYKAGKILKLPLNWSAIKIADYLLAAFDKTYPAIRGAYQTWVKVQVATTRKLVGATGWTRYCFSNPSENKQALNGYVAHSPQSLNAMMVNKAFMRVFYEVWLPNPTTFMLQAQIHDSILFQYHKDYPQLADQVAECMHLPTPVTDINGVTRTLVVPTDVKIGGARWDGE